MSERSHLSTDQEIEGSSPSSIEFCFCECEKGLVWLLYTQFRMKGDFDRIDRKGFRLLFS